MKILHYMLDGWTFDQIAAEMKLSLKTVFNIRRENDLDALVRTLLDDRGQATVLAYIEMRRETFRRNTQLIREADPVVAGEAIARSMAYLSKRESGNTQHPQAFHAQRRASALPANPAEPTTGRIAAEKLRKR